MTILRDRRALVCVLAAVSAPLVLLASCGEDRNYAVNIPGGSGAPEAPAEVSARAASTPATASADASAGSSTSDAGAAGGTKSSGAAASASAAGSPPVAAASASTDTGATKPETKPATKPATKPTTNPVAPSAPPTPTFNDSGEVQLPPAPPPEIVDGEEPYQKLAKDPKFAEFRRKCARYVQLMASLRPYAEKLADGTATDEDRRRHNRIEAEAEKEWRPINAYLWDDRWSEADRAAMGWILYGGMQPKR